MFVRVNTLRTGAHDKHAVKMEWQGEMAVGWYSVKVSGSLTVSESLAHHVTSLQQQQQQIGMRRHEACRVETLRMRLRFHSRQLGGEGRGSPPRLTVEEPADTCANPLAQNSMPNVRRL